MQGYELTDFEWEVIAPLLPNKPRGVPRVGRTPSGGEARGDRSG